MKKIAICLSGYDKITDEIKNEIKKSNHSYIEYLGYEDVTNSILLGKCDLGIIYCGTDLKLVNKINGQKNIRSVLANNEIVIRNAKETLNANILCIMDNSLLKTELLLIVNTFLNVDYIPSLENERMIRLIDQLSKDEYLM